MSWSDYLKAVERVWEIGMGTAQASKTSLVHLKPPVTVL